MVYRGIRFGLEEFGHLNRAIFTDPAEIVTQEIDDHEVFGLVFFAAAQIRPQREILFGRQPAAARAFDRAGGNFTSRRQGEKALRRCAQPRSRLRGVR